MACEKSTKDGERRASQTFKLFVMVNWYDELVNQSIYQPQLPKSELEGTHNVSTFISYETFKQCMNSILKGK